MASKGAPHIKCGAESVLANHIWSLDGLNSAVVSVYYTRHVKVCLISLEDVQEIYIVNPSAWEIKVNLSLSLIKHHTMKMCGGV